MRHIYITILFTVLMSMTGSKAFAHDIAVENADGKTIYYEWTNNNTELAVSYRGIKNISYYNEYTGDIVIPEYANCTGLTAIKIPQSVTSIGNAAFSGCI